MPQKPPQKTFQNSAQKGRLISPRECAIRLIIASRLDKKTFDEACHFIAEFGSFSTQEKKFIRSLYTSFFRHFGQTQMIMKLFFKAKSERSYKEIACLLCLAITEMLFLKTEDHAVIHSYVNLTKTKKRASFTKLVNAVLRRVQKARDNKSALRYTEDALLSMPYWLQRKLSESLDAEKLESLAHIHLEIPPLDIFIRENAEEWAEKMHGTFYPPSLIRIETLPGRIELLPGYEDGKWWVQDYAAMLPIHFFGSLEGKTIHDFCAAPGGKSFQLAHYGAHVIAYDKSEYRLSKMQENIHRLKLPITLQKCDLLTDPLPQKMSYILLDVPCSATGTIRRHPELPWIKGEEEIEELTQIQARMLHKVADFLEPNGILIYCTCSILPEEGEEQIKAFLATHPDFEIHIPAHIEDLISTFGIEMKEGMGRLWPFSDKIRKGSDGFFICALRRHPSL